MLAEDIRIFKVDAVVFSKKDTNFTDVVNSIRAIRKVVTVNVTTPDNWEKYNKIRKDGKEVHKVSIKFVGSDKPQEDLVFFKTTMTKSNAGDPEKAIPGLLGITFRKETLNKV